MVINSKIVKSPMQLVALAATQKTVDEKIKEKMLKFKLTYDAEKKSVKQSLNILLVTTKKKKCMHMPTTTATEKKNLYKYLPT